MRFVLVLLLFTVCGIESVAASGDDSVYVRLSPLHQYQVLSGEIALKEKPYTIYNDTHQAKLVFVFAYNKDFLPLELKRNSETIKQEYLQVNPFRDLVVYPLYINKGESVTFELSLARPSRVYLTDQPQLISTFIPEVNKEHQGNYLELIFCGMVLMMAIYTGGKYVQVRTRDYLFYSLHLFFTGLFFVFVLFKINLWSWYAQDNVRQFFHHLMQSLSHLSYFQFVRFFIHTYKFQPRFDKALNIATYITLGYLAFDALQVFVIQSPLYPHVHMWHVMRMLYLFFGLACIFIWVAHANHPLKKYLINGTAAMLGGGALAMIFIYFPGLLNSLPSPLDYQIFYFRAGIIVEILFFSLGLGYKQKLEVTSGARAEARLQQEQLKLSHLIELDELKSRFFANISHELRTPLALIHSPAEIIEEKSNGEFATELHAIKTNTKILLKLVNQMLDLSRAEAGKLKLAVSKVSLPEFFTAMAQSFASWAEQKKIKFHIDVPEKMEGYMDCSFLEKIAGNLLSNAVKYSADGGEVHLKVRAEPKRAVIKVTDTGRGIEAEHLDKIFERFYRVGIGDVEGTGLGLALTRELVKIHKGDIEVKSEPGKGSEFTVRLPFAAECYTEEEITNEAAVHYSSVSVPPVIQSSGNGTENLSMLPENKSNGNTNGAPGILLVEDNADLRFFIKQSLQHQFTILEASDGAEGFTLAVEQVPDLIITDWMMPKMNGVELCQKLKFHDATSHIPVVLLTAKAGTQSKVEGLDTGADDYLTKPFEIAELRSRVKNLIEQRKLLREKFSKQGLFHYKKVSVKTADDRFLEKLQSIIEDNIGNSNFSNDALVTAIGMSRVQLYRKCTALLGKSPGDIIRQYRMERAHDLLQQGAGNVSEVAWQTGYENLSYFSKVFKEYFGKLPSEVERKQSRQAK